MAKKKLNNLKIEELVTLLDACKMLWDKYNTTITIGWLSDTEHPNFLETKGVLQRHIGEIEQTIEKKIEEGIEWQVTE